MAPGPSIAALFLLGLLQQTAEACEVGDDSSRIAVAGGSLTEIIFFLGAENRIVAVDSTSTFPRAAGEFPSIGYVRALSAEGLLSLAPTMVLGEDDMGPPESLAQVARTGVQIVRVPEKQTAAGIVEKVRCVANVLNLSVQAESLIDAQLAPTIAALDGIRIKTADQPTVALLLQISSGAPIGAGRGTSGDGLLKMASAKNALAAIEGWKPVAPEAMAVSDPDYIVMSERSLLSAGGVDAVFANPAVRTTSSGRERKTDQLIVMDGMAMLGFGPRTLNAALTLAQRLHMPGLDVPESRE